MTISKDGPWREKFEEYYVKLRYEKFYNRIKKQYLGEIKRLKEERKDLDPQFLNEYLDKFEKDVANLPNPKNSSIKNIYLGIQPIWVGDAGAHENFSNEASLVRDLIERDWYKEINS